MSEFKFLDKRDKSGLLLGYSINEFAYNLAEKCLSKIKKYNIYDCLANNLPKKYVDMYFKKLFYEASLPMAGQAILNNWHLKNDGNLVRNKINAIGFPCNELLKSVWPIKDYYFEINNNFQIYNVKIKNIIFPYYNNWLRCKNFFRSKIFLKKNHKIIKNFSFNSKSTIAVCYTEGYDIEKKSDLFWLKESGIDPSSVLVYFDNKKRMKKYSSERYLFSSLKNYGVQWAKVWEWRGTKKKITFIQDLLKTVNHTKPKDSIEKWLKKASKTLIYKVGFWYSFFDDFKVKIHIQSDEMGLSNVVRQIALTKLGGFSVGKIRSYPTKIKGDFLAFYPNDVFFTWGRDSASRILAAENGIKNIIVSGLPYPNQSIAKKRKTEQIENSFKLKGARFILMLIDTSHSFNKNYGWQMVYTPAMIKFYEKFFKWFDEDNEIGIIVKSKYPAILKPLNKISKIIETAKKTGRCYLINSFGEMPNHYTSGVDFAISTGSFFPGVLIQYILGGKRGIFYDYANLKNIEKDIYSWGKDKVFFTDLDKIINELKLYKKNVNSNKELGDWSKKINEHDPFCDGKGGKRIGNYISWLQNSLKKGLEREECLNYANKIYAESWGKDKIIYCSK